MSDNLLHILVTGCAGFIGWRVSERLLAEGHAVTGIDSLNDAYDLRLKRWRLEQLDGHPHFRFYHLDISDRHALHDFLASPHSPLTSHASRLPYPSPQTPNTHAPITAVINLAARAGVRQSLEDPWVYYETNVTGTLNLLECCRESGIKKFVQASSSSVYGKAERPFRESAPTDQVLSPYAASKKAAEVLCHAYHHLHGLDATVLRYFTVYGPAGRPDMSIFRFIRWISEGEPVVVYGDGRQERDFTYLDDIARGTVAALKPLGFETINLGSDRPVALLHVIGLLEQLLDRKAEIDYRPTAKADVLATWADISKARRLLGWAPATSLEEGLERAVAWYQANRDWVRSLEIPPGE
ncbi:MAG: NAD-dependent epimerase/dehydratase family protein [Acidobacteriota bacterium]